MPTDRENELLAMLDEYRRTAAAAPVEPELPDLDPNMFLSAAARSEIQATTQLVLPVRVDLGTIGVARNQLSTASSVAHAVVAAVELQSLWSTPFTDTPMAASSDSDDFGIEFDGIQEGGMTTPIEDVRFQVGRQSPPSRPFHSGVRQGPSEGQVVSRRAGQRFERVENRPVPAPREPVQRVAAHEPDPVPVVRRSVWERLMDDD